MTLLVGLKEFVGPAAVEARFSRCDSGVYRRPLVTLRSLPRSCAYCALSHLIQS